MEVLTVNSQEGEKTVDLVKFEEAVDLPSGLGSIASSDLKAYREISSWIAKYLCSPHKDLGRNGHICPYLAPSCKKGLLWLSSYSHSLKSISDIKDLMMGFMRFFLGIYLPNKDEIYKSIVVIFPTMERDQTKILIDDAHHTLKPIFVDNGLMLGQFHQDCNIGGLHNPEFKTLHSPYPLLVIRNMVPNDFHFLHEDSNMMHAYLKTCATKYPHELERIRKSDAYTSIVGNDTVSGLSVCPYLQKYKLTQQ